MGNSTMASIEMVLGVLAPRHNLNCCDAIGQILWRHRQGQGLQDKRYCKIVEDFNWAADSTPDVIDSVEEAFRLVTVPRHLMSSREWHKILRLLQENWVLRISLKLADVDQIFYDETHHDGEASSDVNCRQFKLMLLRLADAMQVHPYLVL